MSMPEHTEIPKPLIKRAILASAIGNATEWFDYGIYAYGVTYISAALFPGDLDQAVFFALGTFAVSFLIRPLGGIFWGPLGDRLGRKSVLGMTILLMAGATFCVGLIPSYNSIGIAAPIILVILRMIQGFSTGGEYGGAATFMAEYAPDKKRGFYGSFLEVGTLAGFSLGALLMLSFSLWLGHEAMHDWGWRVPFLIAGPMGLIGLYLRARMDDTPVFLENFAHSPQQPRRSPSLIYICKNYWQPLLIMGGLVTALNVVNYTLLSYMPTYFQRRLNLTPDQALMVPIIGMMFMMILLPVAGALSDKCGRKPLWAFSLVGLFVFVVPLYMLMSTGFIGAVIGFVLLGALYAPQLATISATFPAMFPTYVRFAGFAISYNIATSLFGGTAPAFNSVLIRVTGDPLMPAYSMMVACAVGAVALFFLKETAGLSLHQSAATYRSAERKKPTSTI